MVDEIITKQELIDAQKDAQALDDFINGGDEQVVVTRLLKEYPTLANAIRQIYEKGGKFYPTLAAANADIANIRPNVYVITGDNGAYYKATAEATALTKSAYDPLTQAKSYTDTFDSIKINSGKDYPLKQLTRNGTTSTASSINNAILDIKVMGAKAGKVYKLEYYANGFVSAPVTADSWRFTEYDESVFPTTVGTNGGIIVVDYAMPQDVVDRSKINSVTIKSTTHPELMFVLTIDGTKLQASGTPYQLGTSAGAGWSWIIDKNCYQYREVTDQIISKKEAEKTTAFPLNSSVRLETMFAVDKVFEKIEFWGLDDDETVYLRTLWNYFYLSSTTSYTNSVGFNSSKGHHIAIGIAPQSNISLYSQFNVTSRLTSTVEYLLYRNGDVLTEPVGRVRINWNAVNNTTAQRYIKTDNSVPLDMLKVRNVAAQEVLQIAKALPSENDWAGKSIGAIGDSITWGFTPRNDPNGGVTGAQLSSWLVLSAQKLGMTSYNYGISGSTLGANSAGANSPFSRRYQNMINDLDVICVMGGTNDVRKGVPIGTMADRVDMTYYGALHVICQGLIDKYYVNQGTELGKSKQIILMTPIKLQDGSGTALDISIEPYVQAVKDVGAYYSIPVLDMYNLSGITPHVSQTVQGTEEGYMQMYNIYITDGTHPTQQGHEKMANVFSGFLKTLK